MWFIITTIGDRLQLCRKPCDLHQRYLNSSTERLAGYIEVHGNPMTSCEIPDPNDVLMVQRPDPFIEQGKQRCLIVSISLLMWLSPAGDFKVKGAKSWQSRKRITSGIGQMGLMLLIAGGLGL
jgi:hypothetical protein